MNEISIALYGNLMDSIREFTEDVKPYFIKHISKEIIDVKLQFDLFFPLFAAISVINYPNFRFKNKDEIMDELLKLYEKNIQEDDLTELKRYDGNKFIKDPEEFRIFLSEIPKDIAAKNVLPSMNRWTMFDIIFTKRHREYGESILYDVINSTTMYHSDHTFSAILKNTIGKTKDELDIVDTFWLSLDIMVFISAFNYSIGEVFYKIE